MFTDGSRTRIVRGHGQAAVAVVDRTRLRPVDRTLQDAFQPLREHCAGNCADDSPDVVRSVNWTPTWTLRVRQTNCFADFSNNCSDTARLLPGECPDDSSDVGRMLRRMLRGHCADTDWPRTGHGLEATADSVPDIRRNRLGRCSADARTSCRKLRGQFSGRYTGNPTGCCADIARLAASHLCKGMVSSKYPAFQSQKAARNYVRLNVPKLTH